MQPLSYARHQFPPDVIRHAVWIYLRFTLSYRDVEELLAERGLEVSYETIRRWVLKFGPAFARNLRRLRPRPSGQWHLDEMAVVIGGKRLWLWRAVDSEGEIPGHPRAAAPRQSRSPQAHAQALEEAGLCSGRARDGSPALVFLCAAATRVAGSP